MSNVLSKEPKVKKESQALIPLLGVYLLLRDIQNLTGAKLKLNKEWKNDEVGQMLGNLVLEEHAEWVEVD